LLGIFDDQVPGFSGTFCLSAPARRGSQFPLIAKGPNLRRLSLDWTWRMALYRFANRLVLFVHVPKTGGTSLMRMLVEMGGREALRQPVPNPDLPCTPQHFHAAILGDLIPEGFVDFAFMVVRNPYERLASEYRMRIQQRQRDVPFDDWVARMFRRYERNPFVNDNHLRPQSQFILPGVRRFRFENQPFAAICDALEGLGFARPRQIPWERGTSHVPIEISRATQELIARFYEQDFVQLDYSWADLGNTLRLS